MYIYCTFQATLLYAFSYPLVIFHSFLQNFFKHSIEYHIFLRFKGKYPILTNFIIDLSFLSKQSQRHQQNLQIRLKESTTASLNIGLLHFSQFDHLQICTRSNSLNQFTSTHQKAIIGYGNKAISHYCIANRVA